MHSKGQKYPRAPELRQVKRIEPALTKCRVSALVNGKIVRFPHLIEAK
jgi:hypothetical protein